MVSPGEDTEVRAPKCQSGPAWKFGRQEVGKRRGGCTFLPSWLCDPPPISMLFADSAAHRAIGEDCGPRPPRADIGAHGRYRPRILLVRSTAPDAGCPIFLLSPLNSWTRSALRLRC